LIGFGLIVSALLTYGLRNDHLRAGYKERLDTIRIAFVDMGEKVGGYDDILPAANKVGSERARYRQERDQERAANEIMAASVTRLGEETAVALQEAETAQRKVVQLTRERDQWIARARSAATRTERMSAELEVAECVQALSELRASGF
jgi:hypothetical protein